MEGEKLNKVAEMYRLGYSYQFIGDTIGVTKKTINRWIDKLKEQGELKDRPLPTGHTRINNRVPNHNKHQTNLEVVRTLYEADTPLGDICVITGFRYETIIRMVSELHKDGMAKREKVKKAEFVLRKKKETYREGEPHKCDPKTCVFGSVTPDVYGCNFCLITGKCRSTICPRSACTVYERISKSNPRRRGENEPSC